MSEHSPSDWQLENRGGWEKASVFKVIEKLPQGKSLVEIFKKNVPFGSAKFIRDKENTYGIWGEVSKEGSSPVMEITIQGIEANPPLGKVASLRVFENREKYQEATKQETKAK